MRPGCAPAPRRGPGKCQKGGHGGIAASAGRNARSCRTGAEPGPRAPGGTRNQFFPGELRGTAAAEAGPRAWRRWSLGSSSRLTELCPTGVGRGSWTGCYPCWRAPAHVPFSSGLGLMLCGAAIGPFCGRPEGRQVIQLTGVPLPALPDTLALGPNPVDSLSCRYASLSSHLEALEEGGEGI